MKQKNILIIIFLFFIFVFVWIGESIYHSALGSTISDKINNDIAPIVPIFDTKTIDMLKKRQKIIPSFEASGITPTPILPPQQISPKNASGGGKLLL